MKNKLNYTLLFLIGMSGSFTYAQTRITKEVFNAEVTKTINFSDIIPTSDPNFKPNTGAMEGEEEEEKEMENNIRNRIRPFKIENRFEPAHINPIMANAQRSVISPTVCHSFRGMFMGNSIPPDVAGAVGFDHVFITENDSMRILDKNGSQLLKVHQQDPTSVWAGLFTTRVFDPKMVYDPYEQRWVHVILADDKIASSALLIAVSTTQDPMGTWNIWSIDADVDNNQWFDYPSIGFNHQWFVVNGMAFTIPNMGAPTESRTFIFNKAELYNGPTISVNAFNVSGYGPIVPSTTYDTNLNEIWCVTNDDVDDNDLRFFKVSGTVGSPSLTEEGYISIGDSWGSGGDDIAPQLGSSVLVNGGDHRILSVIWRNGKLYTAQTIFLPAGGNPTTSTIQLVVCNPASEVVHESFRFSSDQNSMYGYPSLAVNAEEDIAISCATFTTTSFLGASVLTREHGQANWVQTEYKGGEDWYVNYGSPPGPNNRWGDYTLAAVDPSDDLDFWVMGQYARPKASPTSGRWGIWVAKICAGTCHPDQTMNSNQPTNTYKKFEASNIVYANAHINSGAFIKLDGGNKVILQNGFKALEGCTLRTYIEGCNGPQ